MDILQTYRNAILALLVTTLTLLAIGYMVHKGAELQRQSIDTLKQLAAAFGLQVEASSGDTDWVFLARGSWNGVPLALGIRRHASADGHSTLKRTEIVALGRTDLGAYSFRQRSFGSAVQGRSPRLLTGDALFDGRFVFVHVEENRRRHPVSPFEVATSTADVPWLSEKMRAQMLELKSLEALLIRREEVTAMLDMPGPAELDLALDVVFHLAKWPLGEANARTYR